MRLAVEITLYPLQKDYVEHIQGFIDRLNSVEDLYVNTTNTATLIEG